MGPSAPRAQDKPPTTVSCLVQFALVLGHPGDSSPLVLRSGAVCFATAVLVRPASTTDLYHRPADPYRCRKRAKTEDEKEQRRVERVLRNRRAAQSSRERKRLEVEALEVRNKDLEAQLLAAQKTNMLLCHELSKVRGSAGGSAPLTTRSNPVTFSQELFSSHDGHTRSHSQLLDLDQADHQAAGPSLDELLLRSSQSQATTINPISLSPALSPVPEEDDVFPDDEADHISGNKEDNKERTSSDLEIAPDATQHPAEVLCPDLQCRSAAISRSWTASQQQAQPALALFCQLTLLWTSTSAMLSICRRPLMQIAMSWRAGFSLRPTPALLNTIVWLVTRPPSPSPSDPTLTLTSFSNTTRRPTVSTATTTTSSSSSSRANSSSSSSSSSRPHTTLRLKLLRKILTCSPMLARPIMDATLAALRLVPSEETPDVCRVARGPDASATTSVTSAAKLSTASASSTTMTTTTPDLVGWPQGAPLPSAQVLLTLLWALRVEERKREKGIITSRTATSRPGRQSSALGRNGPLAPTSRGIHNHRPEQRFRYKRSRDERRSF